MFKFNDILDAFEFVSGNSYGMNEAVLFLETGKIFWRSENADIDEITPAVTRLGEDKSVEIPHKNDLDLGRNLVFEFVQEKLPGKTALVENFFRRSGAYSNYKALLETEGLLESWYDFENYREKYALRQWCMDNGIELED
jgi:hypothetical protein